MKLFKVNYAKKISTSGILTVMFSLQLMGVRSEDSNSSNRNSSSNISKEPTAELRDRHSDAWVTSGSSFLREADDDPDFSRRFEFSRQPLPPCCPGEALPPSQRFQQWRVRPTTAGAPAEPLLWAPDSSSASPPGYKERSTSGLSIEGFIWSPRRF